MCKLGLVESKPLWRPPRRRLRPHAKFNPGLRCSLLRSRSFYLQQVCDTSEPERFYTCPVSLLGLLQLTRGLVIPGTFSGILYNILSRYLTKFLVHALSGALCLYRLVNANSTSWLLQEFCFTFFFGFIHFFRKHIQSHAEWKKLSHVWRLWDTEFRSVYYSYLWDFLNIIYNEKPPGAVWDNSCQGLS